MNFEEKTLNSKEIFSGRIIKVRLDKVSLPDGRQSSREVVEHAEAVAIIAVDEEKNVLLVRQYRKPVEELLLEIPAGIMEKGEEPLFTAQRELAEETGFRAEKWKKIASFYTTPGFSNEKIHLYMASDLKAGETNLDEDEFIEIVKMPIEDAYNSIFQGQIVDAKSIIGIQYALQLELKVIQ